jgi:hypothetical protein
MWCHRLSTQKRRALKIRPSFFAAGVFPLEKRRPIVVRFANELIVYVKYHVDNWQKLVMSIILLRVHCRLWSVESQNVPTLSTNSNFPCHNQSILVMNIAEKLFTWRDTSICPSVRSSTLPSIHPSIILPFLVGIWNNLKFLVIEYGYYLFLRK